MLKILSAIVFFPVVIACTKAFLLGLEALSRFNANSFLLISGFFAYPAFHIVFAKPMYIYALGHEIVHVLAAWICGGKVTSFKISRAGGSVATTKSNVFIRLSPYFVPVHTIFLAVIFWCLSTIYGASRFFNEFIFLVGFAMSFHIFMTIEVMKMRQPDIVKTGLLFSIFLIYVSNIFIILFALSLIFKDISFAAFAKDTFIFSKNIYLGLFSRLFG